jgi:Alcohol dehydrogenase GroES-like domain
VDCMPLPTGGSNISSNTTLPGPGGLTAVTPCYRCSYCQRGFTSQCGGPLGGYMCTVQMDGNMAEYFAVPAAQANLTPIPDALIDAQAVYTCRRSRCLNWRPAGLVQTSRMSAPSATTWCTRSSVAPSSHVSRGR